MNLKTNAIRPEGAIKLLPDRIQARLFLLIALALLPMLILLAWISYLRYETRRDQALETELEVARGISATFSAYVEGVQQQNYTVGQGIITDLSYSKTDATHFLTAAAAHSPAIRNLNWVDPTGKVLASSQADLEGRDLSGRPYFQALLAGKPWAVGDLTPSGIATSAPTLAIATAIRDESGTLLGAVVAGIEPDRLGELVLTQSRPTEGAYTIFDRQGVLVYTNSGEILSWDVRQGWRDGDPLLQQALQTGQEQSGVTRLAKPGGDWVAARVPITSIGWVAGARRPVSATLAPVQRSFLVELLIALLIWLAALLLAALLTRTISLPLHRLEEDVRHWDEGSSFLHRPDPVAPIEVLRVGKAVEEMTASLHQRAQALRESEERFRALFHNRHSPMLLIDPATAQIVDANPAASEFYGWSQAELAGMKITQINILPPDQTSQNMGQALSSQTSARFQFRHRLASGEVRDVEVSSGPIQIGEKEFLFSIIHDITRRKQVEESLQRSEQRYRTFFDNLSESVSIFEAVRDERGDIVDWVYADTNPVTDQLLNLDHDQVIGKPIRQVFGEKILSQLMPAYQRVLAMGDPYVYEIPYQDLYFWVNVFRMDEKRVASVGLDITRRKQLEAEREGLISRLDQERSRWQSVVEGIADEVWVSDAQGQMSLINLPAETAMGLEEFENWPVERVLEDVEILNPDGEIRPADQSPLLRSLRGETVRGEEIMRHRQSGVVRNRQYSSAPIRDASGAITGAVAVLRDITDYKQAQEQVAFHAELLAGIHDALVATDDQFRITFWNRNAEEMFGWTAEEALYQPTTSLFQTQFVGTSREEILQRLMQEGHYEGDLRYRRKDGRYFDANAKSAALRGRGGAFKGLVTSIRDITERKQFESTLRLSEERFNKAFNTSPNAQVISRVEDGLIQEVNDRFVQLFGYSKPEVIGKTSTELNMFANPADRQEAVRRLRETKSVRDFELEIRTRSGEIRQGSLSIELFPLGDVPQMLTIVQDITERKRAEEALRLSETRLRRLVEANLIGVVIRDETGLIKDANDAFLELIGYTREDLYKGILLSRDLIPGEYQAQEEQILQDIRSTGSSKPYEKEYRRKDGRRVQVLTGYTALEGLSTDFIGFVLDLTELKQAQAALMEYSDKLKSSNQELEQFAYVASHDLQEPLRKIEMFGNLLKKSATGLDEEQRDYVDRMRQATARMRRMITDLLELSRVNTLNQPFEPVDLSKMASEAVLDLEVLLEGINGKVDVGNLPTIEADPSQIRRLFQNLIGNALKYHKPDVVPLVKVSAHLGAQDSVEIRVKDNGIGFDPSQAERIFQLFQRLVGKSEYEGTGMGLAISRKIVERHHGSITADSAPGEGAEFIVTLPLHQPVKKENLIDPKAP